MKTQSRSRMRLLNTKVRKNGGTITNVVPPNANLFFPSENILTVIDIFSSGLETKNAILELCQQGLPSSQIVVITQNYQEYEASINWEYVTKDGNLLEILTGCGVDALDIPRFEKAVKDGKFLVAAIIVNQSVYHAQHLLKNIGRKVIAVY